MRLKYIALLLTLGLGLVSCKKYLDVNISPNSPATATAKDLLPGIEAETAFNIAGGMPARISAMWTQQLAYNAEPPEWDAYKWQPSDANNTWSYSMYTAILNNLRLVRESAAAKGNNHYLAIAEVLTAYNLGVATDLWGDIPYTEAFQGTRNMQPKYEKQEDIYKTIFVLLESAITHANQAAGPDKPAGGKGGDLIYNGDMGNWKRFAYFLMARHHLRLTYAPGHDKVDESNLALEALKNAFTSSSQNPAFLFYDSPGSENPWYQAETKWSAAFVLSDYFIKSLQSKNDPRLPVYATKAANTDEYTGKVNGSDPGLPGDFSHIGERFNSADAPIYLATYTEALFIKAEATLYTSGAAAALPVFRQAVTESMTSVGLSATEANTYLAMYTTFNDANALGAIMYEKYVANYLSLESYNDWRRTNIPALSLVENAVTNSIPQRWPYPSSERTNNPQPQHGILITENVWWDTK